MSSNEWELCDGCFMFEPPSSCKDGVMPLVNNKRCPCNRCLLKVICSSECMYLSKYLSETKQI